PALLAGAHGKRFGSLRIASKAGVAARRSAPQAEAQRGESGVQGPRGRRRGAQDFGAGAQAPSLSDFAQLSERSGRRPRSEFCASAKVRAPQSSPRSGPTPSGSPFLGSFFWRNKRRNSPAGARPGLVPHSTALTIKHKS